MAWHPWRRDVAGQRPAGVSNERQQRREEEAAGAGLGDGGASF
jgi:hypothetical protein